MVKKLTITVSNKVYEDLHRRVGRRKISGFIDRLARERLGPKTLAEEYAEAARDKVSEREALEWIEPNVDEALDGEDRDDGTKRQTR